MDDNKLKTQNLKLKTEEPEETAVKSDEDSPAEESVKSETDKVIDVIKTTQAGDGEKGVPTRSRSEETSEDARRDIEPAGPAEINASGTLRPSEPTVDEPAPSDQPASTEDPSHPKSSASDDQDDKKKDNPNAKWYVVHTYSGHENKVAHTLKQRVESEQLQEKILDVLVPMQDKIEIKSGKKVNVKEKIFPGYILVKMVLDDASWLAVRTTQGVTSFVGMGNKPTPISDAEVATIVKFTQTEAPMYKQVFAVNDAVKIVDGPFADFIGKVDSVDGEKGKVRVLVSIFGRETPVELDFLQIKKI